MSMYQLTRKLRNLFAIHRFQVKKKQTEREYICRRSRGETLSQRVRRSIRAKLRPSVFIVSTILLFTAFMLQKCYQKKILTKYNHMSWYEYVTSGQVTTREGRPHQVLWIWCTNIVLLQKPNNKRGRKQAKSISPILEELWVCRLHDVRDWWATF